MERRIERMDANNETPTSGSQPRPKFLYKRVDSPTLSSSAGDRPEVTGQGANIANPSMRWLDNYFRKNGKYSNEQGHEIPDIHEFKKKDEIENQEVRGKLKGIAKDLYGKEEEPFVCEFENRSYVFDSEATFEKIATGRGYTVVKGSTDVLELNVIANAKFIDKSGSERTIEIKEVKNLDRKVKMLEEERNRVIEDINRYEQQLSGHKSEGKVYCYEVNGKVYVVEKPDGLPAVLEGEKLIITSENLNNLNNLNEAGEQCYAKHEAGDDFEIKFIPLSDAAKKLKEEVEGLRGTSNKKGLKDIVEEKAKGIFGEKYNDKSGIYKIRIRGQAGNVECNLDSIKHFLSGQNLSNDNIKVIIEGIEKREDGEGNIDKLSFKLSGGEFKLSDDNDNDNDNDKLICSVEKLRLRDASKELAALKDKMKVNIKENMGKLGFSDISDISDISGDMLDNLNDQRFCRFDYDDKVYVATSRDSLATIIGKGTDFFEDKNVQDLKTLGDVNKALEDGIKSLEKHKQDAAKAIFGVKEEWKGAFCLKIPMPKREGEESTESESKDLKDGIIEYRVNDQEIIGFYKNAKSFDDKYKILKGNADDQVTIDKIDKGEKFVIVEKNGGENRGQFTCERLDLYKETADIEVCQQKLSEEVKNLYAKVTGVNIKPDSGLYAHKFKEKVYITAEPELKETDLRKVRSQCRKDTKEIDYVEEGDIKAWNKQAKEAEQAKKAEQPKESEKAEGSEKAEVFGKKHSVGLYEAYRELKKLAEEKKKEPEQVPDSKKTEGVSGEKTKKNDEQKETSEDKQIEINKKIAELYAMDGIENGKFYAYEVEGEKSEKEFGVFVSHEKALEEIQAKFGDTATITPCDDLKHLNVGDTIKYVINRRETFTEIVYKLINAEDLLDLERKQAKKIIGLNDRLGGSSHIIGFDKAKAKDKPWESIRCYEIKVDGGKSQYEVAENPKSMAERIVEHFGLNGAKEGKIVKVGEEDAKSVDDLAKKIKGGDSLTIPDGNGEPITIKRVEQSEITGIIEEEITKVTNEIIGTVPVDKSERDGGLLREYYNICQMSASLTAKNSLDIKLPKTIDCTKWQNLYAARDQKGELKFVESQRQLSGKEISLKDAKQQLEKQVEEKKVPIEFGKLIGEQLEDKIKERFGIKDGHIEYYINPPKYVFECEDSNGRKTYYFTNDEKGPGKKERLKIIQKKDKLDGEALRILKESRDQDHLKIINFKDIYLLKKDEKVENSNIWYITNNGKFDRTPYGMASSLKMEQQINDFMDDKDDKDKKWYQSIWNWGGDSGSSGYDEDDNYRANNRYGQYSYNQPYYNQNSGSFWNS